MEWNTINEVLGFIGALGVVGFYFVSAVVLIRWFTNLFVKKEGPHGK